MTQPGFVPRLSLLMLIATLPSCLGPMASRIDSQEQQLARVIDGLTPETTVACLPPAQNAYRHTYPQPTPAGPQVVFIQTRHDVFVNRLPAECDALMQPNVSIGYDHPQLCSGSNIFVRRHLEESGASCTLGSWTPYRRPES